MRAKLFVVLLISLLAVPAFAQVPYANPAAAGIEVLVAERVMFANDMVNQGNWEPYASAFGDGTLCLAANTEGQESETVTTPAADTERVAVAFFNTDGTVQEVPGFYYSVSPAKPWVTTNDTFRRNGNPPRIGADKRPGSTKYVVANECTPADLTEFFPTFGNGFTYGANTYGCYQLLNKTTAGPVPIGPVTDPTYGQYTTGTQVDAIRYGGDVRALSNGNYISTVEDRNAIFNPNTNRVTVGALISGDTGLVIGSPFNCNMFNPDNGTDCWSGLAAFNGGFAVKPELSADTNYSIFFFDNSGAYQGSWERDLRTEIGTPLPPAEGYTYNTSISSEGRGDDFRIDSDIRSNYVYYAGKGMDATGTGSMAVYVTKIDATTRKTVKEVCANDGYSTILGGPDRVNVCVDENGIVFVCWSDKSNTTYKQIAGRFYDADLNPLSDLFLCFTSSEKGPDPVKAFDVNCPTCAMANGRCLVACRIDNEPADGSYLDEDQIAIVLKIPVASAVGNWNKY